jgi:hypothetical protein
MRLSLNRERAYFRAHQDTLAQLYSGRVIVIKGDLVLGAYDDATWAAPQTRKRYAGGTFFVERVAASASHVAKHAAR